MDMKDQSSPQECTICGETSGVSKGYGNIVCLSCRNFFRYNHQTWSERSVAEAGKCIGQCEVTAQNRNCRSCRMNKCLAVGMKSTRVNTKDQNTKPETTVEVKPSTAAKVKPVVKKSKLSLKNKKKFGTLDSWTKEVHTEPANDGAIIELADSPAGSLDTEPMEEEAKVPCVAALHNLGNTCFLNSVLQVLRYTPTFEEKVAALAKEIKKTERERALLVQYKQVFRKMSVAEQKFMTGESNFIAIRPYDLLDTIERLNPMFQGNLQQDAHEFLRCLLAYIQDASRELNKYRSRGAENNDTVKPIYAQPKEVEMLGGLKDAGNDEQAAKTRSSKRLSAGKVRDENLKKEGQKSSASTKKRRSLTELQNQNVVVNGQTKITASFVKTEPGKISNGDSGESSAKSNGKRKACDNGSVDSNGISTETKTPKDTNTRKRRKPAENGTDDSDPVAVGNGIHDDEKGQGDNTSVTAKVTTKVTSEKKQTARKSMTNKEEAVSSEGCHGDDSCHGDDDNSEPQSPTATCKKEAVVSLDKNGITKYFAKLARPLTLSEIERHTTRVPDCIEELFQGQVALQTRCCVCETVTERREEYQDISVAVHHRDPEEEDDSCRPIVHKVVAERHRNDASPSNHGDDDDQAPLRPSESVVSGDTAQGGLVAMETEIVEAEAEDPFSWVRTSLGEVERLREDNKYLCDQCCHLEEAERSMHYRTVPDVLTLHLKRFAMLQGLAGGFTKLTDHVPLPMMLPCIEDNCVEPDKHRLQLYAVVAHTGFTLSCGHYTAYVRADPYSPALFDLGIDQSQPPNSHEEADPNNNQDDNNNVDAPVVTATNSYWFECDDNVVTVLSEEDFLAKVSPGHSSTNTPYLLFYQKIRVES